MAVQAKMRMMSSMRAGGGAAAVAVIPQKTSATFEIGAPVKADSTGSAIAVSTTASLGTGSTLTGVSASSSNLTLGFAGIDAEASSTKSCVIHKIVPGARFIGNLIHGSGASSAKAQASDVYYTTVYLAKQTASDTHWGWSIDSGGSFGATYINGKIIKLIDDASTANGRVEVEIVGGGIFLGEV